MSRGAERIVMRVIATLAVIVAIGSIWPWLVVFGILP
jgi:hypothetical protein